MKAVGFVRKIDNMGRYILPMNLRRTLNINAGDSLEMYVDEGSIILKKYEPSCIFCGEAKDAENYKGKNVCADCMIELNKNK